MTGVIDIVAAVIRDPAGRVLLVRKHGTVVFMQPGGKREPGEEDGAALARELREELGCRLEPGTAQGLGVFEARAANEPGRRVRAAIYLVEVEGPLEPQGEIAEIAWVDPDRPPGIPLAPLTHDHVLPAVRGGYSRPSGVRSRAKRLPVSS